MEGSSALWSWTLFAGACAGLGYYYWPRDQRRPERNRESAQPAAVRRRKNEEHDGRPKAIRRLTPDRATGGDGTQDAVKQNGNDTTRKRKAQGKEPASGHVASSAAVQDYEPEEIDISTKQFAQQMAQNRRGKNLTAPKSKDQRVKTVKQSSAMNTPDLSASQARAEEDSDVLPATSPGLNAGDVSDMLEPTPSGPSTIRLMAPSKPQKEKMVRQPKEEEFETKKQRQNRKKVDERRLQREAEEKERKSLEEKQRRAAREARGEPAKNGMQAAKPPTSSAWSASASTNDAVTAPSVNGNHSAPLLDTFDAESTSSSNGGMEPSTAATSTTDGGTASWADEVTFEEDQILQALKQSEDESGWTTVAQPKKQQKKSANAGEAPTAEPVLSNRTNMPATKVTPAVNGKPKGFQALGVQYEQRADADPNDASNWDA